jgi:predicted N-acetyltransferase YhbS
VLASVQIRTARPDEYAAVGELTVNAYVGDGLVTEGAEYVDQLVAAADRATAATLLVAVDDGQVLGSVTFVTPGSPYIELAGPGEVEIRMLAVDPKWRGHGLGEALVRTCIERARAIGATRMRLSSQEKMIGAHPIYRRVGFVRTPERDWTPVPGVELLAYALELQ